MSEIRQREYFLFSLFIFLFVFAPFHRGAYLGGYPAKNSSLQHANGLYASYCSSDICYIKNGTKSLVLRSIFDRLVKEMSSSYF